MKSIFSRGWRNVFVAIIIFLFSLTSFAREFLPTASFANFDRRARLGETITVIFIGGSLTWGEGASDPENTSFRALLGKYLEKTYPAAHFVFRDAAIGATGSKLGMFRIDRDVLSHKPDLVFVDFAIEDNLAGTDRETLASYELILRDLINNGIPVVQVLLGTKNYFGPDWTHLGPPRLRDYAEMGVLYRTAVGNCFPSFHNYFGNEWHDRNQIWPTDFSDLSDLGHRFVFEAIRLELEDAIADKRICSMPIAPVFADQYQDRLQFFPALSPLPNGWRVAKTLRPALEIVEAANGWKSQVAMCDIGERKIAKPIELKFSGTFLGVLGEADEQGLGFKVLVDGEVLKSDPSKSKIYRYLHHDVNGASDENGYDDVWPTSTVPLGGGEKFFWHEISDKLKPGRHTLEIHPVFPDGVEKGALRIESICVAGPVSQNVTKSFSESVSY